MLGLENAKLAKPHSYIEHFIMSKEKSNLAVPQG